MPTVIRQDGADYSGPKLNQSLKVKLKNNIEFSLTHLDKICSKGFTNESKVSCFMNVCLQSLLSSPPFFNMLVRIGEDTQILAELLKDGGEERSLLASFVHLARYFNPRD